MRSLLAVTLALWTGWSPCASAQNTDHGPAIPNAVHSPRLAESDVLAAVRQVAGEHFGSGRMAGFSVGVRQGDGPLIAQGFGFAHLELEVPARADTVYRIGSVTKQFTAASILRCVEQGEFELETTLDEFLPDFPRADEVTIRHLLSHTSGIKSYTALPAFLENAPLDLEHEQLLALVERVPYDFEPGDRWLYNNTGYYLLGVILEEIYGIGYGEVLAQDLFRPLGLDRTCYGHNRALIPGRAAGYDPDGSGFVNCAFLSMNLPGAAGALCSTVGDLLEWQTALMDGDVLQPETLDAMLEPVEVRRGRAPDYGFGVAVQEQAGRRCVRHGGGIFGFSADLAYWPVDQIGIAVLCNTTGAPASEITDGIRAALDRIEPEEE